MFPNWLSKRASSSPDSIALSDSTRSLTFGELHARALRMAGALRTAGVQPGARIALLSANSLEFAIAIHGVLQLGCEAVFLNVRLSAPELRLQLEDAGVTLLVADRFLADLHGVRTLPLAELVEEDAAPIAADAYWPAERTLSIMYTSGTTGFPKGVRQTVGNHYASAVSSAFHLGSSPSDRWYGSMPLFHISGFSMLMKSLLYGCSVYIRPGFDEEDAAQAVADGSVTHVSAVATTLARLAAEMERRNLRASPDFQILLAGGGPVSAALVQRAQRLGIPVLQTYGMTETASQIATLSPRDAARKPGSAGKPLFLAEVRIEGQKEEGEIVVRGPMVTPGFAGEGESLPLTEAGWLRTGDIGRLDEEGFLYVLDRRSDLIISGGENIYPAEIEHALLEHPAVVEAGVCGVDDETWGQAPAAFVVLRQPVLYEELREHLAARLARYKLPKSILPVESLPRNASNKLMRHRLAALLEQ